MPKLQEIFNRIQDAKKEQKQIKSMYKDALSTSQEYQNTVEDLKTLKEKKKSIEDKIKDDFSSEFATLENLKASIENDNELLSDVAINQLVKGQTVEVTDKYETQYEPIFSVKFKKVK